MPHLTPPKDSHATGEGPASFVLPPSGISQMLLPVGLALMGVASMMALPRFREDLQGWGFSVAAMVFATVFLTALELARRQQRPFTANLAGMMGVVLLSAVFWSLDQQVRRLVQYSLPGLLPEALSLIASIALLWLYRLPGLTGMVSVGCYLVVSGLLVRMPQEGEPWNSLYRSLPLWMGAVNLAMATGMDKLRPQWTSHATWLHLIGVALAEAGVLLAVQRQWLPMWGLLAVQGALLAGAFWLRRQGLVALLLVITTLQVFLILVPMALGTPLGWDLIVAALGSSLLLCCVMRQLLRRQGPNAKAGPIQSEPGSSSGPAPANGH